MPERDSVSGRFGTIEYTVIRSPRRKRTMGLRVLGEQVEVRAPLRTPQRAVRDFVEAKGQWVRDKLIEIRERPVIPPFGHGDTVPYMGRDTAIRVEPGPVKAVEVGLHDDDCQEPCFDLQSMYIGGLHFHVTTPPELEGTARPDAIRAALTAWYRAHAAEVFGAAVAEWKPHVAPRAKPEVRISGARSQWGSCSPDGVLRFSWRCLMLDEWQISYIAVHELAHLKVRNHSKAFWRVVAKAFSGVEVARRSIRQASKTLPR